MLRVVAFAAITSVSAVAFSHAQQSATFSAGTRTVAVFATVTDQTGRLVPDLTRDQFAIADNGTRQDLSVFANQIQPITVVMLLDRSGSMRANFDLVEKAAEEFVQAMLPADKARIGSFSNRIQIDPRDFTSSHDELVDILRHELQPEGPTPLWNAVNVGITDLLHVEGRRVVLVFTDGDDNSSKVGSGEVTDRGRLEDVMVYSVGLENEYFDGARRVRSSPDRGLKRLSEETGGGFFLLKKTDELTSTFTRVAQELHSQYVLGFTPQVLDGKIHKLEVRLKKPGMAARARKSYVATAEPMTEK
jgi:Ca-activated chloride channel family protein